MKQPYNPRSKQQPPGRVRWGPGEADGGLAAVLEPLLAVVGPLLAGGDGLGEDGGLAGRWVCAPSRESLNQAVPEPPEAPEADLGKVIED